jgi:N-acetylglucosamine kinase-like BadF-type ATPase
MRNPHSNGNLRKLEADGGGEATEENGFVNGVILGLDGGATSTVCVCVPFFSFGERFPDPLPILGRAVAGCTNRNSVGETAARDSLEQVISEALVQSGFDKSDVRGVCLGVSGVNHPSDQEKIENWIRW